MRAARLFASRVSDESARRNEQSPSASRAGNPLTPNATVRERAWHALENDSRLISFFTFTIVVSTLTFILDTYVENVNARFAFFITETMAVSIFTVEYCLKVACAPNRIKFIKAKMSIIDAVAIIPFWVEVFIDEALQQTTSINLSWVRVLRLFRIFRIFKVSKLTYGFKVMMAAMKMSVTSFSVLVFFMLILVILSSSLMYMVEGTDPPHPMQARPDLFATIPDCMWWSIVTMTTVGYGDAVPASPAGKVVATFTMCLGLLAIALPVTVLGSNFTKVMDMFEEELSMVEHEESEDTGTNVSEDELRFFLYSKRQQGLVCETFSRQTTIQVMRQYDKSSKGYLSPEEFERLAVDIKDSHERTRPPTIAELVTQMSSMSARLGQIDKRMVRMEALLERALGGGALDGRLSSTPLPPVVGVRHSASNLPTAAADFDASAGHTSLPLPESNKVPRECTEADRVVHQLGTGGRAAVDGTELEEHGR